MKQIQKSFGNPLAIAVIQNDDNCLYGANVSPTQQHNHVSMRLYPRRMPHRKSMIVHEKDIIIIFYLTSEIEVESWLETNILYKNSRRC
jgi:hypothetical protein